MRHRIFLLPVLLGLLCLGMAKSQPNEIRIRFYTETNPADTTSFAVPVTLLNGRQVYLDEIANISERDIVAVYPFAMPDNTGGCSFYLNESGTMRLDSLSVEKKGTILAAFVNNQQVADIYVDQRVSDGIVTIPNGITTDEMKIILKRFPIAGANGKKSLKKKDVYSTGL
jgi:hypothetical protein